MGLQKITSKVWSFIRWFLFMMVSLLGFLTAPVIFPIAYLLRKIKVFRNNILWIYYDDEDEFGFDVDWWMQGRKKNFWTAYKWAALRNPAWNLQASLRPRKNGRDSYISHKGE